MWRRIQMLSFESMGLKKLNELRSKLGRILIAEERI